MKNKEPKTTESKLGALLDLTLDVLMERLRDRSITAAEMNVLRSLLKDNNISVDRQCGQGIADQIKEVLDGFELEDLN